MFIELFQLPKIGIGDIIIEGSKMSFNKKKAILR